MALSSGFRLGSCEIVAPIGAGGMGEVYRARDTKLNREVAIKVLPDIFAADSERLTRFTREAQTLAALNHPNIAHIYGVEESGTVHALVMELVDGEDLAQRLTGGPIPLDEALPIARQIADALEAAHEQGIVHRDLKPANIKVRPDGTAKVLDFGLAKAMDAGPDGAPGSVANSPTFTAHATQMGTILGTAAYMAPEQARGKTVDRRADIWAFGVVLYEMLTGTRAFEGEEISDVLASVLRQDVDYSRLPPATPASVRRLLRRCLERDRRERLGDMSAARLDLKDASAPDQVENPAAPRGSARALWPFATTALATAIIVGIGAAWWPRPVRQAAQIISARIALPTHLSLSPAHIEADVAASGSELAFVAGAPEQLYLRPLDSPTAIAVAGAAPAGFPTFSPDGQWLAFYSPKERRFKKVSIAGGLPSDFCDAISPMGADWGPAGFLFSSRTTGIYAMTVDGAAPRLVVKSDPATVLSEPSWLPGGRAILYTVARRLGTGDEDMSVAKVFAVAFAPGAHPVQLTDGYAARFVSPHSLIFMRGNTLVGMRFDPDSLAASGGAVTLMGDIADGRYLVSPAGTLVMEPNVGASQTTYVWADRQGHIEQTGIPPQDFAYPRLSGDGTRIVASLSSGSRDLWIWDLKQRVLTRLTLEGGSSSYPVWTPDGRRVIYAADAKGAGNENLAMRSADGTGGVDRLLLSDRHQTPYAMSPDGEWVVYRDEVPGHGTDLGILQMSTRKARPLIATSFNERDAEISPDGKLLAYQSDESGRFEVYVRPFPNVDEGKKQISNGGGIRPVWSRDGRHLYFETADAPPATINSVERGRGPLDFGPVQTVLDLAPFHPSGLLGRNYDVAADGRFLMPYNASTAENAAPELSVVVNWTSGLTINR